MHVEFDSCTFKQESYWRRIIETASPKKVKTSTYADRQKQRDSENRIESEEKRNGREDFSNEIRKTASAAKFQARKSRKQEQVAENSKELPKTTRSSPKQATRFWKSTQARPKDTNGD